MSEPKPELDIQTVCQNVIDGMNQIAQAVRLSPGNDDTEERIVITGPVWRAEIRDTGISVAEVIQSIPSHAIQNAYPHLDEDDIAAALGFAVYAVEASAVRIGENKRIPPPLAAPDPPKQQIISFDVPPDMFGIIGAALIVAAIICVLIVVLL